MEPESQPRGPLDPRTYPLSSCVWFRKTNEDFGGLSNMAPGFPLVVNDVAIGTTEALYQAFRFPDDPELQRVIIAERSPMTAKMRTKPHRGRTRGDWDLVKVRIMRWTLRVKLAQNWEKFSRLLESTGDLPIVESSRKDAYWGAKVDEEHDALVGANVLGRLLMELRAHLRSDDRELLRTVAPPAIPNALLLGRLIEPIVPRSPPGRSAIAAPAANAAPRQAPLLARSAVPGPASSAVAAGTSTPLPQETASPPSARSR